MELKLATFNIRNINDRYAERKPLLGAAFAALDADIVGLQEVVFSPPRQDDFLSSQLAERHYRSFVSRHESNPNFGNAILCARNDAQAHEELRLSTGRSAHRILLVSEGRTFWFANTHLHHKPEEPEVRVEQAAAIVEWMASAPAADAAVIVGDFNTPPFEPAYGVMTKAGYRSAMLEANGAEPAVTWPSGIQAPTMDTEGDPNCLDYIWCMGRIRVKSAHVAANQPAPDDPTMYPSDHFALVADIEIS
ncbi:MAG: endonuclease/exonuclease/phosphatase family protein [Dehalococcoidia bacterium]